MMIIVIVVLIALIVPLVIGSVFVCVPKWWTRSVEPHMPEWLTKKLQMSEAAEVRIGWVLLVLLGPPFFALAFAVWLIRGWFVIGLAAIEGVCPYNGGLKWRDVLSVWFDVGKKPLKDLGPEDLFGSN